MGNCKVNEENAKYLILLSFEFKTECLSDYIIKYLIKTITERDITGLLHRLELAHEYELAELKEACILTVNRNSVQLVDSLEWHELTKRRPELIIELFKNHESEN